MNGQLFKVSILLLLAAFLVSKCAKQAAPMGGPRDEAPPEIVKSVPLSGTTSFKGKSITVTFNEFVVFEKLNEKFMISPPMNIKPKISLKGKSMVIEFMEELRDSTTYTLYFQDAIQDLNEGNPLTNYQFVFSTGTTIDSLSINGNVLLAGNLEPGNNILVMLHRNLADSAPARLLPDYITLADVNGGFRISNISEGNYRLYALGDNNNNKRYDLADESFAFYDSVININPARDFIPVSADTVTVKKTPAKETKTTDQTQAGEKKKPMVPYFEGRYKLFLFTAEKKKFYLTSSSRKMPYQLVYSISKPPDTLQTGFSVINPETGNYFTEISPSRDTITVWLRDSSVFSMPEITTLFSYPYTDSTGKIILRQDTIVQRFFAPKQPRGRVQKKAFTFTSSLAGNSLKPGQQIVFRSQTPFSTPDTSKIKLYDITSKTRIRQGYTLTADTQTSLKYYLKAPFREDGKYLLITDAGSFGNIFGETCDSAGTNFTVRSPSSFGHLAIISNANREPLIIQLLDSKEKLLGEMKLPLNGKVEFPLLEKGFYRVRALFDINNDGRWTTGSFEEHRQPEPVSYLPKEVEIKVDWNVDEEWSPVPVNSKARILYEKKDQLR
jgi:hypothetical protein